jgi:hypothetical protein
MADESSWINLVVVFVSKHNKLTSGFRPRKDETLIPSSMIYHQRVRQSHLFRVFTLLLVNLRSEISHVCINLLLL